MKERILVKENGNTKEITFSKREVERIKSDRTHLCRSCTYCTPLDCKKVKDTKKQTIDKYNFIIDGKEYINELGEVENLVVNECDNYQNYLPRNKKSIVEANKSKRLLKLIFYNAQDIQDANNTQQYRKELREQQETGKTLVKRYK